MMMRVGPFLLCAMLALSMTEASELDLLPLGDPARSSSLATAAAGSIFDTNQGRIVNLQEFVEQLSEVHVLLVGEEHTDMRQKLEQARLLEALAVSGRPVVLGMEFFNRGDQENLDGWRSGKLSDQELISAVGWYDRGSYRFEYNKPVLDVARMHELDIVGLNVPREIVRAVNRGGLESLDETQRAQVGEIDANDSPQHKYLVSRYFGDTVGQMPPAWLDNLYEAQCVWDAVMARSILEALPEGGLVMVVVGSGHVAYDLGIARRLQQHAKREDGGSLKVRTYCPVSAPPPDPEGLHGHPMGGSGHGAGLSVRPALFVRSLADFIGVFDDAGGIEAYPNLGMTLKANDGGELLTGIVFPDSLASEAGFKSGDRILTVGGEVPRDLSHLRHLFAQLEWESRLDVEVERKESRTDVVALLYPKVETVEREVPAGWQVVNLGGDYEIKIANAIDVPSGSRSDSSSVVILMHDQPSRVEIRQDQRLVEVHELDPDHFVARSLFHEPREDGAVEIRYDRNSGGVVLGVRRFDRVGNQLDR
ncbi:MAG: PDZ domain-containing protein [bacterium]|nr:PDZ domain-containing protein [bacterium]